MLKEHQTYKIISLISTDPRQADKGLDQVKVVLGKGYWNGPWWRGELKFLKPSGTVTAFFYGARLQKV